MIFVQFLRIIRTESRAPSVHPRGLRTRENTFPFSVRAVRRSRKTRGHWLRQDDPPPPDECADRGGGGGWLSRGGRARRRDNGVDTASERGEWWRARNARNLQRPSCAPWGAKTRWTVKVDLLSGLLDSLSLSVSLSLSTPTLTKPRIKRFGGVSALPQDVDPVEWWGKVIGFEGNGEIGHSDSETYEGKVVEEQGRFPLIRAPNFYAPSLDG